MIFLAVFKCPPNAQFWRTKLVQIEMPTCLNKVIEKQVYIYKLSHDIIMHSLTFVIVDAAE